MSNAGGFKSLTRYYDMLAGNPVFVANTYDSIATITVGAGGASNVEFTGIPNSYTHLQIRGIVQSNRPIYTTDNLDVAVGNGSIDTGANFSRHGVYSDFTSGTAIISDANVNSTLFVNGYTTTVVANAFGAFVIDILDYANPNKFKTARGLSGADGNGSVLGYNPSTGVTSGSWRSNSSITNIRLSLFLSTMNQYSTFALYGIKG
jgi:hypothetical protein